MMRIITPADVDANLAAAIGAFSQACNYLEDQLIFVITRLLPLTSDMGRVLFSGNQMRRNIEILKNIIQLQEVPILDEQRNHFKCLIPRLIDTNDSRSRLLHNGIASDGDNSFILTIRKDKSFYRIDIEQIKSLTEEAKILWGLLYVNPISYDLSKWELAFSKMDEKQYPKARDSKPRNPPAQK